MMSGYVFNYFIVSQVFGRPRNLQHWALAHDTPHLQWIIQSSQMDGISVHIEGTRRRSTGVGSCLTDVRGRPGQSPIH